TFLRNTVVRELVVEAGHCVGAVVSPLGSTKTETLWANGTVISNLGAQQTAAVLGAHAWPQLTSWRSDNRVLAVQDLVLRRPLRLPPDVAEAPRVYLVWETWAE